MQCLFTCRLRYFGLLMIVLGIGAFVWNFISLITYNWKMIFDHYDNQGVFGNASLWRSATGKIPTFPDNILYFSEATSKHVQESLSLDIDMPSLINNVRNSPECMQIAANPESYWRSQFHNGSLSTSQIDITRMSTAFKCGILDPKFLSMPPVSKVYPFERYYLSEPPLFHISDAADENRSVVTPCNSSFEFKVGDTVAFKIEVRNGKGHHKTKGGDQIRVWFEDNMNNAHMAAKVTDLNNGTYLASAPLPWAGTLRLHVALAYPREYLRAVLYLHRVLKSFRLIAAVYKNSFASEATPCYQTPVIPAFDSSEQCDLTTINGAPWFCGRPIKSQLSCSDYVGTVVLGPIHNFPITDAEMQTLNRSCINQTSIRQTLPCNRILPQDTWVQEIPTGYLYGGTWYPSFCHFPKQDFSNCFKNKEIAIFGDSNGRSHYYEITSGSKCTHIKTALKKVWHKPLLCIHKGNNFTVRWEPHSHPFMHGLDLASKANLIPTAKAIDEIPAEGNYLIILNHYFHLTTAHVSAIDFMFRFIKDALVRLFQRNPNVQVVLQGPHIAWQGWPQHYAAGDMFGTAIMDLQREIFYDIKDKMVFISPWDLTIAVHNQDFHPNVNKTIHDMIAGFMCGR